MQKVLHKKTCPRQETEGMHSCMKKAGRRSFSAHKCTQKIVFLIRHVWKENEKRERERDIVLPNRTIHNHRKVHHFPTAAPLSLISCSTPATSCASRPRSACSACSWAVRAASSERSSAWGQGPPMVVKAVKDQKNEGLVGISMKEMVMFNIA